MEKGKTYMIVGIIILIISVIGSAFALVYYRSDPTLVTLFFDEGIGEYINYNNDIPVLNGQLNLGEDYNSGINTEIEFWKTEVAHNMDIYGHIYLEIEKGSTALLNEPGLKYAVVSNNIVLSEGNFVEYKEGDMVPILVNNELVSSKTYFQIYIWLDENELQNYDLEGEKLEAIVKCEATSERYDLIVRELFDKGYQMVEYIESTGTQYINTNVVPTNEYTIVGKYEITDRISSTQALWCARNDLRSKSLTVFKIQNQGIRTDYDNSQIQTSFIPTLNTSFVVKYNKNNFYVNDNLLYNHSERKFTAGGPITLFASYNPNQNAGMDNFAYYKLYYFKVFNENNVLILNLIPCYRLSDNTIGMYDMINDVFYTNSGSGAFIKGKDIYKINN